MKKATKLLAGATVLAAVTAGMAYAASFATAKPAFAPQRAAAGNVTATWAMGVKSADPTPATYSKDGVFESSTFNAVGFSLNRVRTAQCTPTIDFTTFNVTAQAAASEDSYIEFTVTPAVDFTLTNVSFAWATIKKNDVNADVVLVLDGETTTLASDVNLPKANIGADDANVDFYASYDVEAAATTAPITLRIYPYGSAREIGLANITFTGTTGEGEGGDEPEPTPVPDDCYYHIPGTLAFNAINEHLVAEGPSAPRIEGPDKGITGVNSIGYIKDGSMLTFKNVTAHQAGVYAASMVIDRRAEGTLDAKIVDTATGKTEASFLGAIPAESTWDFTFEGVVTEGTKDIVFTFNSNQGSWIINFAAPTFTLVSDKIAAIQGITAGDLAPVAVEGYDYAFNLPIDFADENVNLTVNHVGGTVAATGEGCTVTDNGNGTFAVSTPAVNAEAIVTFTLTPEEGAYCGQTEYKVRLFHIGAITLTELTIDGMAVDTAVIEALNADGEATFDSNVYTAVPAVTATFIDGTTATATTAGATATKAEYAFTGKAGDMEKSYKLTVDGIHLLNRADKDVDVKITFDAACVNGTVWDNGLYTVSACNDGWGGTQFKLKGNAVTTLTIPGDKKVKQLVLKQLFDNYSDGKIASVTSEGADCWMPTASSFKQGGGNAYDLVINVDNHVNGTPFEISIDGGSQPVMWFEMVCEPVNPGTAPVMTGVTTTPHDGINHAVVTFNFDREMTDTEITFAGETVKAYGGGSSLSFPLWDLPYNEISKVVIPAGAAKDTYGNATDKDIEYSIEIGEEAIVEAMDADRFTVVSNVNELRAAVAALSSTNNTADSPRTVIYILNGDYDLGNGVEKVGNDWGNIAGNTVVLHLNKVYNVSLIGESQEGVLIHGALTGISYPIFSTRYSKNIYMENFTLRNDLDFGQARKGVGVAHYGGMLDVMKNVTLQSLQDTQVTGDRGYYLNCTFHGVVDYLCGGGDHYYDHCTFVMEEEGGVITAPSTSATLKHGYVFQNCTIKGKGKYDLGRPWQNEPRCFWLNTTMEAKSTDAGWRSMGNLPTHFYEYNSMDANGNAIDLSKRQNSPTSTNTYSPILPEEYAPYFNERNVLGSTDSWLATELTDECEAPTVGIDGNNLTWNAVKGAAGYLVFADGRFIGMTTEPTYAVQATRSTVPAYTVAAINANGARGKISAAASESSSVEGVTAAIPATVELFNVQGIRVADDAKGILIRVTTAADGTRTTEKINIR
ncbi:MAG: hypothetical protein HFJ87_03540 [Muribaculaceae bacterium]|nr:hypothetical protein [Muribaculaceae bacterium]